MTVNDIINLLEINTMVEVIQGYSELVRFESEHRYAIKDEILSMEIKNFGIRFRENAIIQEEIYINVKEQ